MTINKPIFEEPTSTDLDLCLGERTPSVEYCANLGTILLQSSLRLKSPKILNVAMEVWEKGLELSDDDDPFSKFKIEFKLSISHFLNKNYEQSLHYLLCALHRCISIKPVPLSTFPEWAAEFGFGETIPLVTDPLKSLRESLYDSLNQSHSKNLRELDVLITRVKRRAERDYINESFTSLFFAKSFKSLAIKCKIESNHLEKRDLAAFHSLRKAFYKCSNTPNK